MKHKNAQIVCFLTRSKVTPTMKNQLCAEFNVYMPEILMANILAVCGWDGGVKVTVTPRILSCCAPPRGLLLFPFILLCPLNSLSPSVLFSVPLCLVLSSLRQSHQVSWLFVAVLTGSPSYCSKPVHTQQNLSGILGGFVLRTLLRTKPGFKWGVFKQTGLGTQGPIPVGKLSCE